MMILHIDFTGPFNEEMSYQENLIPEYHSKDGHEVIILTTCFEFTENGTIRHLQPIDKIMKNGVRLIRMNYRKLINGYITNRIRKVDGVYQLLELLMPEIIFFHSPQTIEVRTIAKYVKDYPTVHIFVDNHADYINSVPNWISRYLLHKIIWKYSIKRLEPFVTKFYGVTPLRCNFLREMYNVPNEKIELLMMGADDDRINFHKKDKIKCSIRDSLRIPRKDFVVITGGKISKMKNIHLLIQAVNELSIENLKLIIFGTPDNEMKEIIKNLCRSERIRNIGWIESDKVYDLFLASDLAVFPGTHSVLWEQSVGTGIPCVFKYWKGMDHIDLGGNCKFLYTDNITEIKSVLDGIINNQIEYQKMKKVAGEIGIKKFSYKEISRKAIQF